VVRVEDRELKISNLDKILWPKERVTKAEVIKYYAELGQYMVAFIRNRPLMAQRYPHGIQSKFFVQKHFHDAPSWVRHFHLKSGGALKGDFILCNDIPTLVWLANLAAIEINHMLARVPNIAKHDVVLVDLDPHPPATFNHARIIARGLANALERLELEFLMKTSGADGIHFFIPIIPRYSVEKIRQFVYVLGKLAEKVNPKIATISTRRERKIGHVYIDFMQNGLEKTITAPLSVRALPGAPVSYPITLKQLEDPRLSSRRFTVRSAPRKSPALRRMLYLSELAQDLDPILLKLGIKK
jgi:bifunctional non-homologous end joining protein LigD